MHIFVEPVTIYDLFKITTNFLSHMQNLMDNLLKLTEC